MKTVNNPGAEPREFAFNGMPYTLPVGLSDWPDDTAFFLQNRMKAQGVRIEWGDEQKGEAPDVPEGRDARRKALLNAMVRSDAGDKEREAPLLPSERRALARGESLPVRDEESDATDVTPEHPVDAIVGETPVPEPPAEQEEGSGSTEA